MNRIFLILASFALVFMIATMVLGLSLGDLRNPEDVAAQRWGTIHRLSGVAAALSAMFVNGIVATYFVGTSRWVREVSDTYSLERQFIIRSNTLKRRTFPITVMSMLAIVAIVALGGAADPGATRQLEPIQGITWAQIHLLGALLGIAFVTLVFYLQWNNIQANRQVIDDVMAQVREVRLAKGLEV
ncbi:MAG: hypothetical protein JNG90_01470 [Planctomycetaceae bacterium]|nr:hypothetical protein [Planctomycetaceae bacterium]